MPRVQSNCVICLLRPILIFGSIVVSLFYFNCPHETKKFYVKYSKLLGAQSAATCIISAIILYILITKDARENIDNVTELLFIINIIITYARIINLTFFTHYRVRFKMAEIRGLVAILKKKDYYGIDSFLTVEVILKYRRYTMVCLIAVVATEILVVGYVIVIKYEIHVVLQSMTNAIGSFSHAIAVLHYILFGYLYMGLFNTCFDKIKDELLAVKTRINVINISDSNNTVALRRLTELYIKLCKTFLLGNKNNQEIVTVSFITYVSMFINSSFLQYISVFYDIPLDRFFFMQAQAFSGFWVIAHYLFVYERLGNIGNDMISFLFKFPINSLSKRNAHQLESLLVLLMTKKPVFTPLNMFQLGSRLLPSILGMTTTYLLVAMQFYVSNTENNVTISK